MWAVIAALAAGLVAQSVGPMRLNTDAITVLSIGDSVATGRGFAENGHPTAFPPGYPVVLAGLLRIGLAHGWVLVLLNAASCLIGLSSACAVLIRNRIADRDQCLTIACLSLLSWVLVKHVALPITDLPFFGAAMLSLDFIDRTWRTRWASRDHFVLGFASVALVATSILIRWIGVALVPGLLLALAFRPDRARSAGHAPIQARLALVAVLLFMLLVGGWAVTKASALMRLVPPDVQGPAVLLAVARHRATELGEVLMNVPSGRLPGWLRTVAPGAGLLAGAFVAWSGAGALRASTPTAAFLASYLAVLCLWPYGDARFWLPLLPFLFAAMLVTADQISRRYPFTPVRWLGWAAVGLFVITGIGALAYSTRISFAGSKFPDLFGDGRLRATYCAALHACAGAFDPARIDAAALHLLSIYR
jgi:hypothetical protein